MLTRRAVLATGVGAIAAASLRPAHSQELKKFAVISGSPAPSIGLLPMFVAQQAGFFRAEGLEVEMRYSRASPVAAQVVSAGQSDVGHFTYDPVIMGYPQGIRGKYFYQYYNRIIYFIGVPVASSIAKVSDLAGKKIGVPSAGSAIIVVAKSILREGGVDPNSVEFVPVGIGSQALSALRSKQVDAFGFWEAAYGGFEAAGEEFRFFRHPKLDRGGSGGYFAADATVQNRSAELAGFGRAAAKAAAFIFANPEAAVRLYWLANPAARQAGDDKAAVARSLVELRHTLDCVAIPQPAGGGRPVFGKIDYADLQRFIDLYSKELAIAAPPTAKDIATDALTAKINQFDLAAVQKQARDWKS
jgi:NitT/TauT family transport system substrate-binding protein